MLVRGCQTDSRVSTGDGRRQPVCYEADCVRGPPPVLPAVIGHVNPDADTWCIRHGLSCGLRRSCGATLLTRGCGHAICVSAFWSVRRGAESDDDQPGHRADVVAAAGRERPGRRSLELRDPGTDPAPHERAAVAAGPDGKIYVAGGDSIPVAAARRTRSRSTIRRPTPGSPSIR